MFEEISSTTLFFYLIVLLLSVISITLFILLIHSGLFNPLEVGTGKPPLGKVVIAYKFQKGPYNESGQTFTEAHIIAPDNKSIGIYYDDPRRVPANELRYVVGSILATEESEIDSELLDRFTAKGFKTMTLPEVEFGVKASFPHVTTLSILIAVHKAYPKLARYIEERKLCAYPFLEYYDGKDINFIAPLSKQEEFWVPECERNDGRGDETLESSDINTTLDTSQSLLDESTDDTPVKVSSDAATETDGSMDSQKAVLETSQTNVEEVVDSVEEDKGDGIETGTGGDDEDNSSSSSFEVLKNDGGE